MLEPIFTGLIAAVFVLLPAFFQERVSSISWSLPIFVLSIGIWNAFFDRFLTRKNWGGGPDGERYDGLADFLMYIHSPIEPVPFLRWLSRTINSFLFAVCGGSVGPEGAAIEVVQAIRIGTKICSARWFEQRRRTEVSMGMAGGIAAAFNAPFAGMLLPLELGLGGRSIFAIVSALTAFLTVKTVSSLLNIKLFNIPGLSTEFSLTSGKSWLEFVLIGLLSALVGLAVVRFFEFIRNGFLRIFSSYAAIGSLTAAGLLVVTYLIYPAGHQPSWILLEDILKAKYSLNEVGFLFFLELLSLSIILAGFGTMGVFWPILMLGGMVGFGLHEQFFNEHLFIGNVFHKNLLNDIMHSGATAGLVGGSALFGVIFGAPITGAILVYEMTQDFHILLPCLIAGIVARQVSKVLKVPNFLSMTLQARGHALLEGRSSQILANIKVEEVMDTDYQTVSENEPLSVLRTKILESRYPFLPVVNSRNEFVGLLTTDMIQEGWKKQTSPGSLSLSSLLEAKDLLYRARPTAITLKPTDPLSVTSGLFDELPCVPVLSNEGRIVGLLFVHNVRLAYDREASFRKF
ncbi:MAG: chloride channel protein [Bdellovibrionia bacterium]